MLDGNILVLHSLCKFFRPDKRAVRRRRKVDVPARRARNGRKFLHLLLHGTAKPFRVPSRMRKHAEHKPVLF